MLQDRENAVMIIALVTLKLCMFQYVDKSSVRPRYQLFFFCRRQLIILREFSSLSFDIAIDIPFIVVLQ